MNHAENTIAMYHQVFLVSAVLAVLCLTLAMVLFFVFRIPGTIGYLSGKTAKRSIERMKQGGFSRPASHTPAVPGTGRPAQPAQAASYGAGMQAGTAGPPDGGAYPGSAAACLPGRGGETFPLGCRNMPEYAGGGETLPLGSDGFQIEEEILVTHTDEII